MVTKNKYYKILGRKISKIRKGCMIKQNELSLKLDKTRATIAMYESGHCAISIYDLYKLSEIFNKQIIDFLPTEKELELKTYNEIIESLLNKKHGNNLLDK